MRVRRVTVAVRPSRAAGSEGAQHPEGGGASGIEESLAARRTGRDVELGRLACAVRGGAGEAGLRLVRLILGLCDVVEQVGATLAIDVCGVVPVSMATAPEEERERTRANEREEEEERERDFKARGGHAHAAGIALEHRKRRVSKGEKSKVRRIGRIRQDTVSAPSPRSSLAPS